MLKLWSLSLSHCNLKTLVVGKKNKRLLELQASFYDPIISDKDTTYLIRTGTNLKDKPEV